MSCAIFGALLALILSACGGGGGTAQTSGGTAAPNAPKKEPTKIKMVISSWPTGQVTIPFAIAMEKGFFKEEGVDITDIVVPEQGGDAVRSVSTGGIGIGDVATTAVSDAVAAGADVRIVGSDIATTAGFLWITNKDSGIKTIKDLAGKKVSFSGPGSLIEGLLKLSLQRAGVTNAQVVPSGGAGETLAALKNGSIDVGWTIDSVYIPAGGDATYHTVFRAEDHVPDFAPSVIMATKEFLDKEPEVVRAVLRGRARGIEYAKANPKEAAEIWAKVAKGDAKVMEATITNLKLNTLFGVGFNAKALVGVNDFIKLSGKTPPDWSKIITQDFLPNGVAKIDLSAVK